MHGIYQTSLTWFWSPTSLLPEVADLSRSSKNKDNEVFVELSRLDLEEKYGSTEKGRPVEHKTHRVPF